MATILVLHGPNLNLLGQREPELYGHDTLNDINKRLTQTAKSKKHSLSYYQSNAEHDLLEQIHLAKQNQTDFIIINPAAFTHTSIALRDAFLGVQIPFIEVHLSNPHARESFRKKSYLSDIAVGVISGFGSQSYELALQAVINRLES